MAKFTLISCILLLSSSLLSQKHDYVWLFGYSNHDNPQDSVFGTSMLDFNKYGTDNFIKFQGESKIDFDGTCSSVSDSFGNYLFSYNGKYIEDASFEPMENGMDLSESGDEDGDLFPQQSIVIPFPGHKDKYILFHQTWKYINQDISIAGFRLYYSVIDMQRNNGLGAVVDRKNLLVQDTADIGKLAATKHANGRDWWLIYPRFNSTEFQRILISPKGVELLPKISTSLVHREGLGQAHFSPDGSIYSKFSATDYDEGFYLYIFEFNRCSGLLNNGIQYHYLPKLYEVGGITFSPNSKILYLLAFTEIYQFDLTSDEIISTKNFIDSTDNYLDTTPNSDIYIPHSFFCGQLGPDGKIYISSIGSVRVLSTINRPNKWGKACQLKQHNIHLPSLNKTTLSNNPNYRLGPIDGSLCDTLGIDNIPLARFRSEQSSNNYLKFDFLDLSNYEPEEWYWEFGDGNTSNEINPGHIYAQPGIYEVCLTVHNDNGSDTHCQTMNIATTSTANEETIIQATLFPNPCRDFLNIRLENYYPKDAKLMIYDVQGRMIKEDRIINGLNSIPVYKLNAGLYFIKIVDKNIIIESSKITINN